MKPAAILFMVLILSIVWGGLIILVLVAIKKEKKIQSEEAD